jgi:hypothetical protein
MVLHELGRKEAASSEIVQQQKEAAEKEEREKEEKLRIEREKREKELDAKEKQIQEESARKKLERVASLKEQEMKEAAEKEEAMKAYLKQGLAERIQILKNVEAEQGRAAALAASAATPPMASPPPAVVVAPARTISSPINTDTSSSGRRSTSPTPASPKVLPGLSAAVAEAVAAAEIPSMPTSRPGLVKQASLTSTSGQFSLMPIVPWVEKFPQMADFLSTIYDPIMNCGSSTISKCTPHGLFKLCGRVVGKAVPGGGLGDEYRTGITPINVKEFKLLFKNNNVEYLSNLELKKALKAIEQCKGI